MKQFKKALVVLLLAAQATAFADCNTSDSCGSCSTDESSCSTTSCCDLKVNGDVYGKTFYSLRPQDSNAARAMAGVIDKMHLFAKEEFYGQANVYLGWQQTYGSDDLAKWFSFNGKRTMTYGNIADGTFDINGLQFGTTASGTISFCPKIQNFIANLDLYFGWDEFVCGLWTRLQVPIVYTRWNLNLTDKVTGPAGTYYAINTVSTSATTPIEFTSLKAAWVGDKGYGVVPALTCGRICGRQTDTAVAGVHFDLGYDFIRKERGHLGVSIHAVAPTGTTPSATFLFNAVAGANHSWQLGASVNGAWELWNDCDGDRRLAVYLDSYITHLFAAKQTRLLGLRTVDGLANPGASFLTLKHFSSATVVDTTTPLVRAANVLCNNVRVSAAVMADIALMLEYDSANWSVGLGWNFWIRTAEKLRRCSTLADDTYAIANLGADSSGTNLTPLSGSPINTNTSSLSTIGKTQGTAGAAPSVDTTHPTFLTDAQVDPCVAQHPSAFSNKVFGFAGYNWRECEWQPFVSLYAGVEFGNNNKAADQWEVGIRGGVAF